MLRPVCLLVAMRLVLVMTMLLSLRGMMSWLVSEASSWISPTGQLMLSAGSVLFAWNTWRRLDCCGSLIHADVLEYYDQTVNSPNGSFYIPAVLRVPHLLQIVKRRRIKNNLSRKNILCRDSFTCQYCSSRENLTIDHVLPIVRGGEWKWENLVTACARCNSKKGQKTLEEANMKLTKVPKAPKDYDILAIPLTSAAIKMLKMRKGTPEEWLQYLSKPSSEP
ncbi:hypothetical protein PRUPE_7G002400 [Prunus persica]|uniref:HNH nuclease domain-containing protein n=1 Tax=Prunus persica TaxID=3760 RepID=A0A251N6G2_PRUPE|nr:hypothetical protein PRUPE_7G002400 [Prunus persica]